MVNFTQHQIDEIISQYKLGKSLIEIADEYSVCRATIKKVIKGNYPAYTGKRRALKATENMAVNIIVKLVNLPKLYLP